MTSPLTWKLTGDVESNQIAVTQNAADDKSPLDCTPECPQEEYVYDYQYAGSDHASQDQDVVDVEAPAPVPALPAPNPVRNQIQEDYQDDDYFNDKIVIEDYQVNSDTGASAGGDFDSDYNSGNEDPYDTSYDDSSYDTSQDTSYDNSYDNNYDDPQSQDTNYDDSKSQDTNYDDSQSHDSNYDDSHDESYDSYDGGDNVVFEKENAIESLPSPSQDATGGGQCPGGELVACVDICPGHFGPRVFGACVSSCGRRCP